MRGFYDEGVEFELEKVPGFLNVSIDKKNHLINVRTRLSILPKLKRDQRWTYQSLIERKKGPGLKEDWQKKRKCPNIDSW